MRTGDLSFFTIIISSKERGQWILTRSFPILYTRPHILGTRTREPSIRLTNLLLSWVWLALDRQRIAFFFYTSISGAPGFVIRLAWPDLLHYHFHIIKALRWRATTFISLAWPWLDLARLQFHSNSTDHWSRPSRLSIWQVQPICCAGDSERSLEEAKS